MTAVVVALHLVLDRSAGPSITADEAGYLGNARWLAGQDPVLSIARSPFYGWGYAAVLAPVHWVVDDPGLRWDAILAVNALLLGALVPLLHAVGRRILDLRPMPALVASVVAALGPGVVGTGAAAVAENLSLPLAVVAVLALHASVASSRWWARVAFGPVVAALYATHPRFAPVVVVVAVALVVALVVGPLARGVALANLVGLGLGVAGVRLVDRLLVEARWLQVDRIEGGREAVVSQLTTADGLQEVVRSTLGQGWYLAVGTLGLTLVGVVAVAALAAGRPLTTAGGGSPTVAARVAAGGTLVMAPALAAVSVYFFARTQVRDDHLVYGRHNETFVPLWLLAGVATVLDPRSRAILARTLAGAAAVLVAVAVATVVRLDPVVHGGDFAVRAVPALARVLEGPADEVFLRGSLVAVVGLVVVGLLAVVLRRPALAVAVVAAWLLWVGVGRADEVRAETADRYRGWEVPEALDRLGVEEAAIDARAAPKAVLTYPFALPEVRFVPYVPDRGARPDTAFVVASAADADLADAGGRLVLVDEQMAVGDVDALGVWVMPGPEQEALAAAGRLRPP
ncbi:hypothetical protein PO878_09300 [Iamia majanohamensis]|uniref:Uncharacterized protein n=1 Tax=Iamia majanohamensis TaxID=467976 RepID=A0AAF0BXE5_9ACTN|nr:hypothetical protein [Iamia majanohamensis]WCO68918.1 hypothetical protein PO878_09300 [Iamia majanohamensis]